MLRTWPEVPRKKVYVIITMLCADHWRVNIGDSILDAFGARLKNVSAQPLQRTMKPVQDTTNKSFAQPQSGPGLGIALAAVSSPPA